MVYWNFSLINDCQESSYIGIPYMGKLLREKTFEWEMAVCDKTFAVAFLYIDNRQGQDASTYAYIHYTVWFQSFVVENFRIKPFILYKTTNFRDKIFLN